MSTKDKFAAPFGGLTFKDWQIFARNHLELMQGAVLGAEALYKGWYNSGMSPYEAADLAFSHELDSMEAEAVEKQEAAQAKEERNLKASVKSFNIIEAIIEDSEGWTLDKIQVMAFRSWLEAVQHELDLLAKMSLYRPGEWDYWLGYSRNYTPNQEAARIYVAKLDD